MSSLLEWMSSRVVGSEASLAALRRSYDLMAESTLPGTTVRAVGSAGVHGEWVEAPRARVTLLYFHGGGYTLGSPSSHRGLASRLAAGCEARVFVVDYRLAPEHPFPAAFEDAERAWSWLLASGVASDAVVLGGDSAGGGVALALAMRARDAAKPPAGVFAFSGWTDLAARNCGAVDDPILSEALLSQLAAQYLAGADPTDVRASPARGDVSGLPPLLLQVGEREVLLEDSRRLARRVESAGGRVYLEVYPEMIHVFQMYSSRLAEARRALRSVERFVRSCLRAD